MIIDDHVHVHEWSFQKGDREFAIGGNGHLHVTSIRVAKSFDISVPVGSLKKASVSVDWFSAIT